MPRTSPLPWLIALVACACSGGGPAKTLPMDGTTDTSIADSADSAGDSTIDSGGDSTTDTVDTTDSGTAPVDDATLASFSLPTEIRCNEAQTATVVMHNAGTTTWTAAEGYKLGAVDDSDPFFGTDTRVTLPDAVTVPPGTDYTFTFTLNGTLPGAYTTDWQMVREGVAWFGQSASQAVVDTCGSGGICDGTEFICSDLADAASVESTGGVVNGGDFNALGYEPPDGGGLDWTLGPGPDFTTGHMEVDVTGLQPNELDEGAGGKVSIFDLCGLGDDAASAMGLQKMAWDYHEGNNFRYYLTTDDLSGGSWGAAIITAADMGCYYSIADPAWQADETHHIVMRWAPDRVRLEIDGGFSCESSGSGADYNPADKIFVLGNRCQHYSTQQAIARFKDLRVWVGIY